MKKKLTVLVFTLSTLMCYSQDTAAYKVSIAENKFIYSRNTVKIFNGQRISVSASETNNHLENLKLINAGESKINSMNFAKIAKNVLIQNSEKYISIDFNVVKEENGKLNTFLVINNPYNYILRYKAKMFSRKANDYLETSIWDVEPRISGIEQWPYAITDIILYDFKLIKK